jgi:hypothetical protein
MKTFNNYNIVRGILFSIPLFPIGLLSGFMAAVTMLQIALDGWGLSGLIGISSIEMMDFTDNISIFDWLSGGPGATANSAENYFRFMMFAIPTSISFYIISWSFTKKD